MSFNFTNCRVSREGSDEGEEIWDFLYCYGKSYHWLKVLAYESECINNDKMDAQLAGLILEDNVNIHNWSNEIFINLI